jgi:hypothetical protein
MAWELKKIRKPRLLDLSIADFIPPMGKEQRAIRKSENHVYSNFRMWISSLQWAWSKEQSKNKHGAKF